jgi:hypothetical protein
MRAAVLALAISIGALGCAEPIREQGPAGYARREYVQPPVHPEIVVSGDPAATAIAFAEAQLGKRYCWGGNGPSCFDCSGLVQSAWKAAGARLPRTTDAQARALVSVPLWDVRPGDIFWWSHGHVGLYVGNGTIIDAYHSGAGVVRRRAPRPERVLRVAAHAAHAAPAAPGYDSRLVSHGY